MTSRSLTRWLRSLQVSVVCAAFCSCEGKKIDSRSLPNQGRTESPAAPTLASPNEETSPNEYPCLRCSFNLRTTRSYRIIRECICKALAALGACPAGLCSTSPSAPLRQQDAPNSLLDRTLLQRPSSSASPPPPHDLQIRTQPQSPDAARAPRIASPSAAPNSASSGRPGCGKSPLSFGAGLLRWRR